MKTILFCAATLLISGITLGQTAKVEGRQSTNSKISAAKDNSTVQGAGSVASDASLAMDVKPQPVVKKSKKAAMTTKSEVNSQSAAAIHATGSTVENGAQYAKGASASFHVNDNNAPKAVSVNSRQSVNTQAAANKSAKVDVKSRSNVSANTNVRPVKASSGGFIKTGTALGLK